MSQSSAILKHLKAGYSLTPLAAFKLFDCLTLSQRCTELRQRGHAVQSRMVKVGNKKVAQYSLGRKA